MRLCTLRDITLEAIPAADIVGMSMLGDDGCPTTAVYTDPESPAIDEGQYRDGKGPCLDAWRKNVVIPVPRIHDVADTYPAFSAAFQEHGVQSTLSLPMQAGDVAVGALNLYARLPESFGEHEASIGRDLGAAAAAVLVNVSAYWTAFDLTVQMKQAMESRAVIEQAKGILMAGDGDLTADGAFDRLRRASQREHVHGIDVSRRLTHAEEGGWSRRAFFWCSPSRRERR